MEENKTKYKDVTEDFVYMIDAFSCDFDLAVQKRISYGNLIKRLKIRTKDFCVI